MQKYFQSKSVLEIVPGDFFFLFLFAFLCPSDFFLFRGKNCSDAVSPEAVCADELLMSTVEARMVRS